MAADKYDQAGKLLNGADEKRGVKLFADALRKSVEIGQLLKSQMKLFADQSITDSKTLTEKIKLSWGQIKEKQNESQSEIAQGRRLLDI